MWSKDDLEKKKPRAYGFAGFEGHFGWINQGKLRWYGHILRRNNGDVLRRALDFEVVKRSGRGRPNMTWKRQVEEHTDQTGLKREDAIDKVKWRNGVYELSKNTR